MALQRFIPTSPDANIKTDSDMATAKFGHLNALVDSLQGNLSIANGDVLSSSFKQVVDSNNTLSGLILNSGSVGSINSFTMNRTATSWERGHLAFTRGDILNGLQLNYGVISTGRYSSSVPRMSIFLTNTNPNDEINGPRSSNWQDIAIFNDGRVGIGYAFPSSGSSYNLTAYAKLEIRAETSTNATHSLIIKNSAQDPQFAVRDDGTVGIGLDAELGNDCAVLQVTSTTKGVLFPRLTTVQKNAIPSPVAGLQVYDTTLNEMSFYNGSAWVSM